jgi:hypothetical protein
MSLVYIGVHHLQLTLQVSLPIVKPSFYIQFPFALEVGEHIMLEQFRLKTLADSPSFFADFETLILHSIFLLLLEAGETHTMQQPMYIKQSKEKAHALIISNFLICSLMASGSFFKMPTSRTFFLSFLF